MSIQNTLQPYAIHELVDAAKEMPDQINPEMPSSRKMELQNEAQRLKLEALQLLSQTRDFLTEFYPEKEIPTPDVFLRSLENTETVTPYITLYNDPARGDAPVAAIVAYVYRTGEGKGIGFVKYAAISPDYAKDEADKFLQGEVREHIFYITDSMKSGEYRGTFLEVYAPNMDSTPSRKQLGDLDAELVNPGDYTVPSASRTQDSYSLHIVDADTPDEPTDAYDLKEFLEQYATQDGYGPAHPAFRDMQARVDYMTKNHIPILRRTQNAGEQMTLAGLGNNWDQLPLDFEP